MSSLLTRNEDQEIETEVQKALSDMMPLESDQGDVQIDLKDVHIDKSKDDLEDNPGYINDARAKGKSYEVPMKGTFQLKKDGEVLQEHDTKIGPYYPVVDNLGTRMINGMHYQNKFQVRREPGIYPTRKEGDAMVEFNSQQGGSFNFVVDADNDDTPTLDVQVIGQSRKTVERGVYALLKVFEVPESEIQDIMGDFYKYNHQDLSVGQAAGDAAPLDLQNVTKKIFTGITPNKLQEELPEGASFEEMAEMLRDFLTDGKAFESDVNRKTIDVETEKYSAETIKQSARKLVQTLNGRENPTHRFSEEFRRIHGIPTQLRENLKRDSKLKGKMSEAENRIDDALQSGETPDLSSVLSSVKGKIRNKVQSTYKNSALSTTTETNNILDIDNRGKEITIKGPGGIQSEHAIQPENIELHPSRLGLIDVVNTPTGSPGRSMPLAKGARIGEDGEVQREVYDRKQGEKRIVSAQEIAEGNIGFADDFQREETEEGETYEPKQEEVYAGVGNEVKQVPEEEVRYVLPDMTDMLADGTNIVPFVHHNSGPRAIMGARQMAQGVSLKDAESPLVDPVDETGETFSKRLGHRYNVTAEEPGTVKEVQEEAIVVETDEGEEKQYPLFNDLPLNQGGFIDHSVKVDPGDQVEEGDLMTTNNYTDEEGKLAVGKNLDVAYMPMSGFNYEDSMVMSEKGAEKLTSEHVYEKVYEAEPNDEQGLDVYSTFMRDRGKLGDLNRDTLGADGIIQEGATVEEGDALVTAIGKANLRNDPDLTRQLKQTFKEFGIDARDRSVYWNKPDKGVVTRVETDKDGEGNTAGVRVYVKTEEKFKEGDKITVRAGGKGITSKVLPEDKMPKRKRDGKVPDLLVDPHGVPSRANVGQIFENAAGKVADKKGETYKVKNFDNRTDWEDINQELEELGIDVQEDFEHPETGETIPDVNIGKQYVAKLKHMLNKKFDARGVNEGYDMDEQPVGGASMDNLTVHSMIGHNARANLSEMAQIKGTENQDYWYNYVKGGRKPKAADTPFSFDKFKSMIESLGVSVEEDQKDALKLTPMTDKDIERKSAGEIENPGGYQTPKQHDRGYGRQKAVTKGLFDPNLVGEGAENWNHIELPEPVPNPLFKKGLQYVLEDGLRVSHDVTPRINKANGKTRTTSNMTQKDVKNLYIGDASVEIGDKTYSGGEDLKELLSTIDVDKTMEEVRSKAEDYMQGDFKAERADMYKSKLKFLGNLQENDVAPEDAFMLSKVPVMPGKYRRPLLSGDGKIHRQPTNKLYGEVLHGKAQLEQSVENYLGEEEIKQDRKGLMQDLGALFGDGSSPRGNIKAKSIMDQIAGGGALAGDQNFTDEDDESKGPKGGYAQRKVMKKKQDLSGRSTIIPSGLKQIEGTDALGVDEVGLPEEMAWTIYEPFVRNQLSKELGSAVDAKEEYEDRTDKARKELRRVMENRPVLLNRDPSWWQHNVTAHEPKLISEDPESNDTEKAIRVPNQVVAPFQGGDFDGDSVSLNTFVVLRMMDGHVWQGRIKELVTGLLGEIPSENYTLSFGPNVETLNSDGEWVSVKELTIHQTDKPTYKIETRGGYTVRVTSDHSMMVGGEEVAPQNLEEGEDVLDNVWGELSEPQDPRDEILGIPAGTDAGFIIGLMAGDGGCDDRGRFYFSVSDDEILDRLQTAIDTTEMGHLSVGDFYEGGHDGSGRTAILCDAEHKDFGRKIVGRGAYDKKIHGRVLDCDDETLKGVVSGYIVADGSVEKTGSGSFMIRTWSRSRDLRDSFSSVLWRLGIPHNKRQREHRGDTNYLISIGRDGIERMSELGIDMPGKDGRRLENAIWEYEENRTYAKRTMPSEYRVESVERVEQEPVVADMTVEGDHVFCVGPGIIVHNTMSAHVPVTDAAVNEAHSMKPSRNLRAPGSKKLLVHPDHSQLLGLHDLSQVAGSSPVAEGDPEPKNEPDITDKNDLIRKYNTGDVKPHQPFKIQGEEGDAEQWTPGWALIDDAIKKGTEGQMGLSKYMEELQSDHPDKDISMRGLDLDDEGMEDVFLEGLVRRFPDKYADISHKLSMLGSQHATKKGFTVGFDDVKPEDSLAEKHYEQSEQYIGDRAQIIAEEKGKEEPDEADYQQAEIDLNMGTDVTVEKGEGDEEDKTIMGTMKRMEKEIKERDGDNPLVRMMQVGSRSSPNQIRQLLGTFGMVKDVHKNRVPRPVKNSLNRGLKGGEYYLQQHGALMGLRDRSVETSKPGYLGKQIIAGSQDLVVTERDCGTTAGKEIPLKEDGSLNTDDLNGRFLAESGEEIDGSKLAAMERSGQETVKVRSPLTCEAEEGVCAACYGRTENGNMPDLGEDVGVREGQGIIEASTKLTLKAMHETGSADKTAPSFDRFQEIVQLKSPNFKAHIAEGEPGETFEIEETEDVFAQGGKVGTDVTYTSKDKGETRSTRIPPERRIRDKIEPGAELEAGEKITEAGHFDPDEMQKTKGLEETRDYLTRELHSIFNEIGGINRRGAETTLAAMTDFARVRDPGDSDFVPGENVQSGKIEAFNQQAGEDEDPVVAEGQLTPVGKVPFHGENWLSKMNFQNLKRELTTSAQEGHEAEIRGTSPVSAYMYGKGFDKGLDPDRWEF